MKRLLILWLSLILALFALSGCSTPFSTTGPTPSADVFDPQVGACFDYSGPDHRQVTVSCRGLHAGEVFALIPYPSSDNDLYPGSAWLEIYSGDECLPYFEAYTGRDYAGSGFGISTSMPDEGQWTEGRREIVCTLYQPTGSSPLYKRIRGSMKAARTGLFGARPLTSASDTAGEGEATLYGNWTGTDAVTDAVFLFRIGREGRLETVYFGGSYGPGGSYEWVNNDAIRLSFQGSSQGGLEEGLCASVPTFLQGLCQNRVVDPASYPGPAEPISPPPFGAEESAGPPYPAPSPAPIVVSHIDSTFTVTVDEETLTLTHASGVAQTFERLGR